MAEKKKRQVKKDPAVGRAGPAPCIKSPFALVCRLAEYFYKQDTTTDEKGRSLPYTMAGLYIAARTPSSETWSDYINGRHDQRLLDAYGRTTDGLYTETDIYIAEKRDINRLAERPELQDYIAFLSAGADKKASEQPLIVSGVMQKAKLLVQQQDEQRLKIRGQVGDIFVMKVQHGWIEEDKRTIVHEHKLLPSSEDARKALQELQLLGQ